MAEFNTDHLTLEPDAEAVIMEMVREENGSLEGKTKRDVAEPFKNKTLRQAIVQILNNQFVGGRARDPEYRKTVTVEDLREDQKMRLLRFTIRNHLGLEEETPTHWSPEKGWQK